MKNNLMVGIGSPKPSSKPPSFAREAAAEGESAATEQAEQAPKADAAQGAVAVSPEAVCFRSAQEVCANCSHMGADSQCAVLKMAVTPQDSCNAYSGREDGAADMPQEMQAQ